MKNLIQHAYMPIIWLTLLAVIIWIVCPLFQVPIVLRIGLIFAIAVTIHYAQYNYLFCVIYLCMELFGLWHDSFYREKS